MEKIKNERIRTQTLQDMLFYNDALMVDVKIQYPETKKNLKFNHYYWKEARKSYLYARKTLFPQAVEQYKDFLKQGYPFNNYILMQVFKVTYNVLPLVSLYRDVYQYAGGAHGTTEKYSETWDMDKSKILKLEDLFKQGYDYNAVIMKYITKEALKRQEEENILFEEVEENMAKYYDENNYYLTKYGLAIFYPLYTIAPYASGIQVFIVPYKTFGDNLTYPVVIYS